MKKKNFKAGLAAYKASKKSVPVEEDFSYYKVQWGDDSFSPLWSEAEIVEDLLKVFPDVFFTPDMAASTVRAAISGFRGIWYQAPDAEIRIAFDGCIECYSDWGFWDYGIITPMF